MFHLRSSGAVACLLWLLGLVFGPAHAHVAVQQSASSAIPGAPSPAAYFLGVNDVGSSIEHTLMPPGSRFQAYGLADLSGGVLRASATSDLLVDPCCNYGGTYSYVSISDHFSFSGPFVPGQMTSLDFLFEGTIARGPLSPIFNCCGDAHHGGEAVLQVSVHSFTSGGTWTLQQVLQDNGCWAWSWPCATGLAIHQVRQLVFPVLNGQYQIDLSLNVNAIAGYTVDFANTARFYLDVPPNLTLQSESGVLFATAAPVPEPATALLWLAGGCVLLKRPRRH